MGSSEERLKKIAAGPHWNADALANVRIALTDFIETFDIAAKNPGWKGASADAAVDRFITLSKEAQDNVAVIDALVSRVRDANAAITAAGDATLPEGSIDPGIKAAVVGGASVMVPGYGAVASIAALSLIENAMSGGREDAAKTALEAFKTRTENVASRVEASSQELVVSGYSAAGDDRAKTDDTTGGDSPSSNRPTGGGGGGGGPRGVGGGPDFPGGGPGGPGGGPGGTGGIDDGSGGSGDDPTVMGPFDPPRFEVPDDTFPPPTGPRPSVDGGIDGGTVGGPGGVGGGGQLGGLPGGAGGASGVGGASMGGAGLLGGAGGGAAMLAGARMASGGAGGLGSGLLGAKAGMGGAGVGGAGGSAGSGAGGATNAGARGGTGMMGGGGARPGDEEEKERRGLGLFAPKLEDDDDAPAVPNAARAGSRAPKAAGS